MRLYFPTNFIACGLALAFAKGLFAQSLSKGEGLLEESGPPALSSEQSSAVYPDNPEQLISDLISQALEFNRQDKTNREKYDFYLELCSNYVDLKSIVSFVLGGYAKRLSEEEFSQFISLFEDQLALILVSRFSEFSGEGSSFQKLRGFEKRPGFYIVAYNYTEPGARPLPITWIALKTHGAYRLVDVQINGLSLATSQRSEYLSFVRQKGLKALIEALALSVEKQKARLF